MPVTAADTRESVGVRDMPESLPPGGRSLDNIGLFVPLLVENVPPDLVDLVHVADPARAHVIGVVVGRITDFGKPKLAGSGFLGDTLGESPLIVVARRVGLAITGEGELTAGVHLALIDYAADGLRKHRAAHAIENHLGDCDLAAHRLAACFEIDGSGEAAALALLEFGLALALALEAQTLCSSDGRRARRLTA